jgi:hypothetical protein
MFVSLLRPVVDIVPKVRCVRWCSIPATAYLVCSNIIHYLKSRTAVALLCLAYAADCPSSASLCWTLLWSACFVAEHDMSAKLRHDAVVSSQPSTVGVQRTSSSNDERFAKGGISYETYG